MVKSCRIVSGKPKSPQSDVRQEEIRQGPEFSTGPATLLSLSVSRCLWRSERTAFERGQGAFSKGSAAVSPEGLSARLGPAVLA